MGLTNQVGARLSHFREKTVLDRFFHGLHRVQINQKQQITLGHTPNTVNEINVICRENIFKKYSILCFLSDLASSVRHHPELNKCPDESQQRKNEKIKGRKAGTGARKNSSLLV